MPKIKTNSSAKKIAESCVKAADQMMAEDIVLLNIGKVSIVADYFLICSGNSSPHLNAIASKIEDDIRENFSKNPFRTSGTPESGWLVLDYGSVMVHIFSKPQRERFKLEELWNDAPEIKTKTNTKKRQKT